jgi:hypothetical protein
MSFCVALDAVLYAQRQAGSSTLLGELEKLEILDSSVLMSSSAANLIPSRDVARGRLLPATEVAAPPCWRVREWLVRRSRFRSRWWRNALLLGNRHVQALR